MRVARVILGAILVLSILWANIPTAALASGPMCHLACCAGRVPHAAGSCMNGSCHAFLMGRPKTSKIHLQLPVHESEQLCGLRRRTTRNSMMSLRGSTALTLLASSERSRGSRVPDAASVSTSTLGKPCQPDCGTGAFSSSSRGRSIDKSAAAELRNGSKARLTRHAGPEPPQHASYHLARHFNLVVLEGRPGQLGR